MRILREDSLLLLVDMQERLFPVMDNKEALLENCRILLQGMEILDVPLIVSEQYPRGLGSTLSEIKEFIPGFSAIEKISFSCLDEAAIASRLEESGRKNILLCGIESHVCVLQTALDLREKAFCPVIVSDAISSRKAYHREQALQRFQTEGILSTSVESILFELCRTAASPAFKAISKLVK